MNKKDIYNVIYIKYRYITMFIEMNEIYICIYTTT